MHRTLLIALVGFETLVCAGLLVGGIASQWDADGMGRGIAAAYAIGAILAFLCFVLPALLLVRKGRSPGLALILLLIPLVPMIGIIGPMITSSEWYISWFVWRRAPWHR
jgi:hypothetical protein